MDGVLPPTLAGIVLFGKPLARRLPPMVHRLHPRARQRMGGRPGESLPVHRHPQAPADGLPRRRPASSTSCLEASGYPKASQSVQEPILPRKVIREALANAAMHRSYNVHSPTQIIRYSNRIEVRNVGYSAQGTRATGRAGLTSAQPRDCGGAARPASGRSKGHRYPRHAPPGCRSRPTAPGIPFRPPGQRVRSFFLHNLLTEDDHAWLRSFAGGVVSDDEAKVLIYARETGSRWTTAPAVTSAASTPWRPARFASPARPGLRTRKAPAAAPTTCWPTPTPPPAPPAQLALDIGSTPAPGTSGGGTGRHCYRA